MLESLGLLESKDGSAAGFQGTATKLLIHGLGFRVLGFRVLGLRALGF